MPFQMQEQQQRLYVTWVDEIDINTIQIESLKAQYYEIEINGVNKQNEQFIRDIINKTKHLKVANSVLNLSMFVGSWMFISFHDCVCEENFENCTIYHLVVEYCQLTSIQIHSLQLVSMRINLNNQSNFDFSNDKNINCRDKNIIIKNQTINLDNWQGYWQSITLENCTYIGEIKENSLKLEQINIKQCDINKFKIFQNILCENKIFFTDVAQQSNQQFDFEFNNKQLNVVLHLQNYICNLDQIINFQGEFILENCLLLNNSNIQNNQGKIIKIIMDENMNYSIDFNALRYCEARIIIQIEKLNISFLNLNLCSPEDVELSEMIIDFKQIQGKWNKLTFNYCEFLNEQQCQLEANQLKLYSIKQQLYFLKKVKCSKISLNNCLVSSLPESKSINIVRSTVNIQERNKIVETIAVTNCKLVKFTLSLFPELTSATVKQDTEAYKTFSDMVKLYFKQKQQCLKRGDLFQKQLVQQQYITKCQNIKVDKVRSYIFSVIQIMQLQKVVFNE
ncbi:Hypothetical_protein [Hexamita inflata]|uniref:Hypothetical_protein n=1 Tax=Hexamita inflata TaxID=28002 RepID=A0AA86UW58_9EUKA|nr:Hypothetical protein HINF_LOCUS54736 [Hexamita inflata]